MDKDRQSEMVEGLKTQLRTRGINPEKYITTLLAFQKLLEGIRKHDEFEVVAKIIAAMEMCLEIKHNKFHKERGYDEKRYSDFN